MASKSRGPFRLLFIKKQREVYGALDNPIELSAGLSNSIAWVVDMLKANGIEADYVQVVDNNDIDREVTKYQPTHCIIEAFWVVPEKFDTLRILHPTVQWVVRNHSEIPFLSNEGIAMEWLRAYFSKNVQIACNSQRSLQAVEIIATSDRYPSSVAWYAPNVYPIDNFNTPNIIDPDAHQLNIGCFGAVRPLKNQLQQALGAINFGNLLGRSINFNISATRVEQHGNEALRNLRALFAGSAHHKLIERPWHGAEQFLALIKSMDISMQVSLSESFNLVSADAVSQGVAVVVGPEVTWLGPYAHADPSNIASITEGLLAVWGSGERAQQRRILRQQKDLINWVKMATDVWVDRFGPH
jgi:hypothetical protein